MALPEEDRRLLQESLRDPQVDPDEVMELANLTSQIATEVVDDEDFKGLEIADADFAGLDTGALVATAHGSAHQVVSATLKGVKQDLEDFSEALETSIKNILLVDDTAESMLLMRSLGLMTPSSDVTTSLDDGSLENLGDITVSDHGEQARDEAVAEVNGRGSDGADG